MCLSWWSSNVNESSRIIQCGKDGILLSHFLLKNSVKSTVSLIHYGVNWFHEIFLQILNVFSTLWITKAFKSLFHLLQPYDPKRSCWVPIPEGGFVEGVIDSAEGDKVSVKIGNEKKVLKKDQVQQVNPPKFEKCEDMSNLTYLNEASVLHNLKARYYSKLIYVSKNGYSTPILNNSSETWTFLTHNNANLKEWLSILNLFTWKIGTSKLSKIGVWKGMFRFWLLYVVCKVFLGIHRAYQISNQAFHKCYDHVTEYNACNSCWNGFFERWGKLLLFSVKNYTCFSQWICPFIYYLPKAIHECS